jgi:O-methyltransferase involved in polyketide biosynthesis
VSSSEGDLSVTALYTAGVWAWAELPAAELLAHDDSRRVFAATSAALAVAGALRKRGPSLKHSLVQRHVMIDRVVEASRARHVLELAAGLSARGLRFTEDPGLEYVEVDRPIVVARKRALLDRSEAGKRALQRPNLRFLARDVEEAPLAELAPGASPSPLAVVAEGLLMYLDAAAQQRFFARVRALFVDRPGVFVFDFVPPSEQPAPGIAGRALGALMRKATRGADFARDPRGRDAVAADLRAAGFADVALYEPHDAPADWQVPHLGELTQQLVFVARVR